MTDTKQPEALRLADELEREKWHLPAVVMQAAAEYLRRQHARIVELEAQLSSSGFTAADMATAAAQGFRDGVASLAANSGSEPVAGMNEYGVRGYLAATIKCWHRLTGDEAAELVAMTQRLAGLYLHPSPPEGRAGGWMPIETAPKDDPIIVAPTKRMGICVAMNDSRDGWVTETCSEWVSIYTPTHWMPIPPPPTSSADSRKGE